MFHGGFGGPKPMYTSRLCAALCWAEPLMAAGPWDFPFPITLQEEGTGKK